MTEEDREPDQLRQRRANFEELVRLGVDPYPRTFARTHTVDDLVEAHSAASSESLEASPVETTTAGRVMAIRSFGKANFLVISDGQSRIQVYVRKDALPERDFAIFKLLDFGDFIGVRGKLFRTKTNELTIFASSLEFLVKCFIPLPEKWHGLSDVEIRYRQRYLDLTSIPIPGARSTCAARCSPPFGAS
jgi:lysyl-tRNA synthetase class 2